MGLALVLGGGGARGWAHIGVIEELDAHGLKPTEVVGCSIGAIVGAFSAADRMAELRAFAEDISFTKMVGFFDLKMGGGGLIAGDRVVDWLSSHFGDMRFEDLELPFAVVATDVSNGREIWLRSGPLVPAIRASIALPGVFGPVPLNGRWLADGGMTNPVPVSLARAGNATHVIAVDLNAEITPLDPPITAESEALADGSMPWSWIDKLTQGLPAPMKLQAERMADSIRQPTTKGPGYVDMITRSMQIMMRRVTMSRLAGDPPDLLLTPYLDRVGVLEFNRAADAIEEGRAAVTRADLQVQELKLRAKGLPLDQSPIGNGGARLTS